MPHLALLEKRRIRERRRTLADMARVIIETALEEGEAIQLERDQPHDPE